jgi:hypothetical protein
MKSVDLSYLINKNKLIIISALYLNSDNESQKVDVSKILQKLIQHGRLLYTGEGNFYNKIFSDPAKSMKKVLRLEVKYKGLLYKINYNENQIINLPNDLKITHNELNRKSFLMNPWTITIGGVLATTLLGYIFLNKNSYESNNTTLNNTGNIIQLNKYGGDNVIGNKNVTMTTNNNDIVMDRVQSLDVGKTAKELPNGIYFFEDGFDISNSQNHPEFAGIKANGKRLDNYFEIQKKDNELLIAGFINAENYSRINLINKDNALNFMLFPLSHNEFSKGVLVPFNSIASSSYRYLDLEGTGILDIKATKVIGDVITHID